MLKPSLAIMAVAALSVGYGVNARTTDREPSAQPLAERAQPRAPAAPHAWPDQPVHQQMRALDRHARVGMILYTGPFSPAERAAVPSMRGLGVSAVTLPGPAPLE